MGLLLQSRSLHSSWRLQGRIHFLPFPVSRGYQTTSNNGITPPSLTLTLLPLSIFKDSCDYNGSTMVIQDSIFLSKSLTLSHHKVPLPLKITQSQDSRDQDVGIFRAIIDLSQSSLQPQRIHSHLHADYINPYPVSPTHPIFNSIHHQLRVQNLI